MNGRACAGASDCTVGQGDCQDNSLQCSTVLDAAIDSATFKPSLFGIDVVFKRLMYLKEGVAPNCEGVFDVSTSASFGAGSTCGVTMFSSTILTIDGEFFRGFRQVTVAFGAGSTLAPGHSIVLDARTAITVCNQPAATVGTVTLPHTGDIALPTLQLRSKTTSVGLCDDVFVAASVSGAGPWSVQYTWTEASGQLLASLPQPIPSDQNSVHIAAGAWPQASAAYTVCVTATAQYTHLATEEMCVELTTSIDAVPKMMSPSLPAAITASSTDYAFSLSVPHTTCNDPSGQLEYAWKVEAIAHGVRCPSLSNTL
jgi:hypothetical protein